MYWFFVNGFQKHYIHLTQILAHTHKNIFEPSANVLLEILSFRRIVQNLIIELESF